MAMRVTQHNGRKGKDGVYSTKHNDRNDTDRAEHIDKGRSQDNRYWIWEPNANGEFQLRELSEADRADGQTFDKHESDIYGELFSPYLAAKNARYEKQRHSERCQTMDDFRRNERTCPEETIFQIGKKDNTTSPDVLIQVTLEYLEWEKQAYPLFKPLDMALHVDEQGAAHIQRRGVWTYQSADGLAVGQDKSLEAMGVELPDRSKPKGRFNNRKQTFSADCRAKLEEICRNHGIELETERLEPSKVGRSLLEYQTEQEREKLSALQEQTNEAEQELSELQGKVLKLSEVKKLGLLSSRKSILDLKATVIDLNKQLEDEKKAHQQTEQELKAAKKEKKSLSKQLDTAKEGKKTAEQERDKLSDVNTTLKVKLKQAEKRAESEYARGKNENTSITDYLRLERELKAMKEQLGKSELHEEFLKQFISEKYGDRDVLNAENYVKARENPIKPTKNKHLGL